jgi:hypothetical protein
MIESDSDHWKSPKRSPREFVVVPAAPRSDDVELRIAAPDGKTREESLAELNHSPRVMLPLPDVDRERAEQLIAARKVRRFSLFELMAVVTLLAVLLGVTNRLPVGVSAGVMSLASALGLLFLHAVPVESRLVQLAWITTFVFSVIVAIIAVIIGV